MQLDNSVIFGNDCCSCTHFVRLLYMKKKAFMALDLNDVL